MRNPEKPQDTKGEPRDAAFAIYLRTGRRPVAHCPAGATETKFNPWHDREDGRFTFSGQGRFFGPGSRTSSYSKPPDKDRLRQRGIVSAEVRPARRRYDLGAELRDPQNAPIHVVKRGDSLSRIAATRRGLSVESLAWANGIPENGILRVGQKLRVPTQAWLDANKVRFQKDIERIAAVDFYLATHGNRMPIPRGPNDSAFRDINVAKPPSIDEQIDRDLKTTTFNGYRYTQDGLVRVRNIRGDIPSGLMERRSRRAQANAGGKDRLPTHDGGHYVAPHLGGVPHPINHFPQDSGINRGQYRIIEKNWTRARDAGHRVSIDITPRYRGTSLRPYALDVVWYVDGKREEQRVGNDRRGK